MSKSKSKRAAIVLAAGKGTRMKSGLAKVLHEANGLPLAYYPVKRSLELRCDPVVVVVGHQGSDVRKRLEGLFPGAPLKFVTQAEQKGTAHAVLCARRALAGHDGRVLILYGDVPLLRKETLSTLIRAGSNRQVAFLSMRPQDSTGYGRVVRDEKGEVRSIVEHKDANTAQRAIGECNAGLYDCDATFLWKALKNVDTQNAQGEFYLTDLVAAASTAGQPAVAVVAPVEEVSGVNDRVELAEASRLLRRRLAEDHMRAGVTFLDPATAWLDEGVSIGVDVVIEPNVRLAGKTRIGEGARIGQGSVLVDSSVGAGSVLKPYTVLEEAKVGERVTAGPFARLRPGTDLAEGVRIGNFVEIKNTRMEAGSKANHLTYLGDAQIGEGSNVGAGTITCNYDGVNKLPTVLGKNVFIGSDTQLVAPVTIGDGAYVAAGSTIVSDVPAGALALSRPVQVVKEGWATQRTATRRKTAGSRKAASRRVKPE